MEFFVLDDANGIDFSNYEQPAIPLYGATQYYGSEYKYDYITENIAVEPTKYVLYTITPYPDYSSSGLYITSIEITDPDVNIYGISINSESEDFKKIFNDMGYEVEKSEDYLEYYFASKNGITYSFEQGIRLCISVELTNVNNVKY